jgi:CRP/FNR family transcriptional regulator
MPWTGSCAGCTREDRPFCRGPKTIRDAFDLHGLPGTFPRGALLFSEGERARGIFMICDGRVKLTTTSAEGRTLIARIAGPGDVLGASATLLDTSYETSAEVLDPSHVTFLGREAFRGMATAADAALQIARELSATYEAIQRDLRRMALAQTTTERLASFLLDWCERSGEPGPGGVRIHVGFTHEELGQMIGTTRETVTRILSALKRKNLVTVHGATMYVDVARLAVQN